MNPQEAGPQSERRGVPNLSLTCINLLWRWRAELGGERET